MAEKKVPDTSRIQIAQLKGLSRTRKFDVVVKEEAVSIFLNDQHVATSMCSPSDLEQLAIGYLMTEGLIKGIDDVKSVAADKRACAVWVQSSCAPRRTPIKPILLTSGCGGLSSRPLGRGLKVSSKLTLSSDAIRSLLSEFQKRSILYRSTGGAHGAALCTPEKVVAFCEDIGRHNAVDKVIGEGAMKRVPMKRCVLVTSGRIMSEMISKAAIVGIPIIISKSAPSDRAVKLAKGLGVTAVGFVRGTRMNVYSNDWRVVRAR